MYCLEKLQRELAYFFSKDIRELPKVESLLADEGYTQIRKGDEIIKLKPIAQAESTLAYTDTKGHTHQIPTDIAQKWLETFGLKDLQESYTPKFSEQVAQALEPILQGGQITLSANSLVKLMQRDRLEFLPYIKETLETPNAVVKQVDGAIIFAKDYRDEKLGKFFASVSKNDQGEWIISSNAPKNLNNLHNKIKEGGEVLYSDLPELPIIAKPDLTAKALNSEANQGEIIPQTEISNIKKQLVELKKSKLEYQKVLKSLERNMKDVELEERRYLRGEERIKVFERKRLVQSSIDEHTQGLNAVLKKMIELHKQLPENVRYTKEVLDDLTKVEAILKGNDYSLEQALTLSKITQRLQEKAIIESESFLNKVYNLDDFAKGAKSLQETSYAYNTDESIKRYFKTIAEMIDSIPAFKKISANPETLPKADSSVESTPKDTQTQPTQKSLFDEADSSEPNFTYTTGEARGIAELRKDLKAALEPYKSTPIINKETGLQGVVTTDEINKIASKKAVDKSVANGFTRDEHFTAAQDLKNLFENATKAQSHNDYKQRENIAQVHRFIRDLHINDKSAQAKITLFEKIEGKNRIYTLELESLNKPDPLSASVPNTESAAKAQSVATARPETTTIAKTDEQSIAQNSNALLESTMKKFNYDEKKAKDLLEWHKDSHPLTKDENGVPKVFYHGTRSDKVFEVFDKDKIHSGYGFWFGDDIADRAVKENTTGKAPVIKAFLQMKKPFIFSNQGITAQNIDEYAYITGISKKRITELYEAKEAFNTLEKLIQRDTQADSVFAGAVDYFEIEKGGKDLTTFDYRDLNLSDQTIAFLDRLHKKGITARGMDITPTRAYEDKQEAKEILERLKEKGYDSMVWANNEFVVFEPNQIKHIDNRGSWVDSSGNFTGENPKDTKPTHLLSVKADESTHKYFNESSPNIFHSNPHAGAGLLGGSAAGVEQDENGNITFSPEKFALGLLGGAIGSKAVAKGLEWRARKVAKSYPNIAKDNPTLMQEIAKRDLQTYAMTNTHNALTRFLNNNKLLDVNPQLFAGEKALVNEAYAPHKARLERAKELESSGADEIEIWEKTGWYKDKDKKWKFEISQRGGELYTKDEYGRPYKREYLHKILKDDELFNAYPKLRDLRVIEDKKLGRSVSASYDPKLKDIYIKNLQAKEAKISLYHEIQHAIQDIEGFAYGFKDYVTSDENFHKYAIQHGEVEARNVESRMKLPTKRDVQNLKRFAKDRDKNIELMKTSDYEEWYKNKRIKESQSEKKHFLAAAQTAQEIINKGKYTDHPHKTMDTPLKDTIAESTMQGEALSKELESSFLDSSGKIDYKSLMDKAEALPEQVRFTRFKEMIFTNPNARQIDSKNAVIQTPAGEVKVNVLRAFSHYRKNGKYGNHKENRQAFNATFMPTLLKPKFVTKDEAGTLYYYKPFMSKDKEYHITSIAVKKDGTLDYATSYNATENRLNQMIKYNELVFYDS